MKETASEFIQGTICATFAQYQQSRQDQKDDEEKEEDLSLQLRWWQEEWSFFSAQCQCLLAVCIKGKCLDPHFFLSVTLPVEWDLEDMANGFKWNFTQEMRNAKRL